FGLGVLGEETGVGLGERRPPADGRAVAADELPLLGPEIGQGFGVAPLERLDKLLHGGGDSGTVRRAVFLALLTRRILPRRPCCRLALPCSTGVRPSTEGYKC